MNFISSKRYSQTISLIDRKNRFDPNIEIDNKKQYAKELLYSMRMSSTLNYFAPNTNELVNIAARGQHIGRWSIPRSDFPEGRKGYHLWRKKLTDYHCEELLKILSKTNYSSEEKEQVENLLRKKDLKNNTDSQLLQDVVSLVFLTYYALEFAIKHPTAKVNDILKKMLNKMSEKAIEFAKATCPKPISDILYKLQ